MKKRKIKKSRNAQAGIIVVILLILVILTTFVVVWKLVIGNIEKNAEQADIDAIIKSIEIPEDSIFVKDNLFQLNIKRNNDNIHLSYIKIVVFGEMINKEYKISNFPKSLESKSYVLNITGLEPIEILVYPVMSNGKIAIGERKKVTGQETDTINTNLIVINPEILIKQKDCISLWQCSYWDECHVVYNLDDIINKGVLLNGQQERLCKDKNNCEFDVTERRVCDSSVSIILKKVEVCEIEYLEVSDKESNLISRLNLVENRLNIQFILDKSRYYPYCFNNIKDCDEDGVDCVLESGGSCPVC